MISQQSTERNSGISNLRCIAYIIVNYKYKIQCAKRRSPPLSVQDCVLELGHAAALEGHRSRHHEVEEDAQGPQVHGGAQVVVVLQRNKKRLVKDLFFRAAPEDMCVTDAEQVLRVRLRPLALIANAFAND